MTKSTTAGQARCIIAHRNLDRLRDDARRARRVAMAAQKAWRRGDITTVEWTTARDAHRVKMDAYRAGFREIR